MDNLTKQKELILKHLNPLNTFEHILDLGGGINNIGIKTLCVDIVQTGHTDILQDLNETIQLPDEFTSYIISSNLIEHLRQPLDFLLDVKRVLREEGKFILITPNGLGLQEMLTALTGKYAGIEHYCKDEGLLHHIYVWNKYNMDLLLEEAGFKIEHFEYTNFYWGRNKLFKFIAWLCPIFRPSLFYVLSKKPEEQIHNVMHVSS